RACSRQSSTWLAEPRSRVYQRAIGPSISGPLNRQRLVSLMCISISSFSNGVRHVGGNITPNAVRNASPTTSFRGECRMEPLSPEEQKGLTRERLVEAALELIDKQGLEGLSMRALAERLQVKAASLYWHVRDRDELLGLLADAILESVSRPPP